MTEREKLVDLAFQAALSEHNAVIIFHQNRGVFRRVLGTFLYLYIFTISKLTLVGGLDRI